LLRGTQITGKKQEIQRGLVENSSYPSKELLKSKTPYS